MAPSAQILTILEYLLFKGGHNSPVQFAHKKSEGVRLVRCGIRMRDTVWYRHRANISLPRPHDGRLGCINPMGSLHHDSKDGCPTVKVRPHYAVRHTAAKCCKAAWQKLRHARSICGRCLGLAVACCSMLCGLKI